MDAQFIKAVQKTICKWVLGDSGVKPERSDIGDIITAKSQVEGCGLETGSPEVVLAGWIAI